MGNWGCAMLKLSTVTSPRPPIEVRPVAAVKSGASAPIAAEHKPASKWSPPDLLARSLDTVRSSGVVLPKDAKDIVEVVRGIRTTSDLRDTFLELREKLAGPLMSKESRSEIIAALEERESELGKGVLARPS